jgi:hypothetical protein
LTECWATDAASFPDGKTFFYLSVGPKQIGVVVGDTPTGPFTDPLGKALIPEGLVPTYSRDPGVLMDDDGSNYLIFGTFKYFIAKLAPDMISLAESLTNVKINHEQHSDDKPFLHKMNGIYYLSWGCWYAMGQSPTGPFNYTGGIINTTALENTTFTSGGGTKDRHGSFFTFRGQTYFTCNDESHGGSGGFRSSIIAYVHYRANGTIVNIRIDETGVGSYNLTASEHPMVAAAEFYAINGTTAKKVQRIAGLTPAEDPYQDHFEVVGLSAGAALEYPRFTYPTGGNANHLVLTASNGGTATGIVNVMLDGKTAGQCSIAPTGAWDVYVPIKCVAMPCAGAVAAAAAAAATVDVKLSFSGTDSEFAHLTTISIS